MGVSFETCLRRREDVPLRRLGDVPLRRHWVFHSRRTCDVTGTCRETLLRRRYDVLLPGGTIPWMFSLNHITYSGWLPVFLHDMKYIPSTKPEVFNQLVKGSFAAKKSPRVLSNIEIDQAHEQLNKDIKIDVGAT